MKLEKFIIPIIIFLIGLGLTYLGALLKIIHFEIGFLTGNLVLTIATGIKIFAIILTIIKFILIHRE